MTLISQKAVWLPPHTIENLEIRQIFEDLSQWLAEQLSAPVTWESMPLTEAWANLGGANQIAQVGKDLSGKVYLRGVLKSLKAYAFPATNTTIATLPKSLWPKETQFAGLAWQKDSAGNFAAMPVAMSSTGNLVLTYGNSDFLGATNGTATYLMLPSLVYSVN